MNHLPHTTTPDERAALLTGPLSSGLDVTEDHHDCSRVEYDGGVMLFVCPESHAERPDRLDPRFAVLRGHSVIWTGETLRECVSVLKQEINQP